MFIFTLFLVKRWGVLVPFLAAAGGAIGLVLGGLLPLAPDFAVPAKLILSGLFTFLLLFIADHRIQEGGGEVVWDSELDQAVVYEESSGSWLFITFRGWMIILPLVQVGLGLSSLAAVLFA